MNRESEFGMPSQRRGREVKCGTCAHHMRTEDRDGGWECSCDTSDYFLDITDYNFGCIHYEPRVEKRF